MDKHAGEQERKRVSKPPFSFHVFIKEFGGKQDGLRCGKKAAQKILRLKVIHHVIL